MVDHQKKEEMEKMSWFKTRQINKNVGNLASLDPQCQTIIKRIEDRYGFERKQLGLRNLSNYFFIDMLEQAFEKADIKFSSEITVLDVGTSRWDYAPFLLGFLTNWKRARTVHLEGVEFNREENRRSVKQKAKGCELNIYWDDVMNLSEKERYDIVFVNHMLSGHGHCREWGVPYYPANEFFSHLQSLGKQNSLIVIIAYHWAGESAIINCISEQSKLANFDYKPSVGKTLANFLYGYIGFHNNKICVAENPYLDLQSCIEHEESRKEWDEIQSAFSFTK
jgi:hypothetical protein